MLFGHDLNDSARNAKKKPKLGYLHHRAFLPFSAPMARGLFAAACDYGLATGFGLRGHIVLAIGFAALRHALGLL
jgi:hypothetical protein